MTYDAVIIGSGPNGLSAGCYLARQGLHVLLLEAHAEPGGGTRTAELTLPGFHHDVCSAVHPFGYLSPYFQELHLERYGLEWVFPRASVAHPLDGQDAVILSKSLTETAAGLGVDDRVYRKLLQPLADHVDWLMEDALGPLGIPNHPLFLARFGMKTALPATLFSKLAFRGERAQALFAGCTAHSVLPFDKFFTTALGLTFLASGHGVDWPVAKGGSQAIAGSLVQCFEEAGGEIRVDTRVTRFDRLPPARAYLFDTNPHQLATIAGDELPAGYRSRLERFVYGPGIFKIDYALNGPIPWADPRCLEASTVHLGGTFAEIAAAEKQVWHGKHAERPYVLLAQQSQFDGTRAPAGMHTSWAYCHVPNGSAIDQSEVIERQIERFAPGFRDRILARSSMNAPAFEAYNPNYVGGAVTGGAADITQLFTRPVARVDPYSTPNPKIFICSASSPPGGGVHGMNGFHAARSVVRRLAAKR